MEHIYSEHINGGKLTDVKDSVSGIVLHNDFGSKTPREYLPWLYAREQNGQYVNGWASVYINRNECLWYHPTNYTEWHCGHYWANRNLIGIEVVESYPGHISDDEFMENEEAAFEAAASILKSYGLTVNEDTVQLHRFYFSTSCPHRSWDIHVGVNAPNTEANQQKLVDYFIERISFYYDGGVRLPKDEEAKTVKPNDIKAEIDRWIDELEVESTDWDKNKYGTWYKTHRGTFVNGDEPIQVWNTGPFRIKGNEEGKLPKGAEITFDEYQLQDGHVWVSYESFENEELFLPIGTWDGTEPPNQEKHIELWGDVKH